MGEPIFHLGDNPADYIHGYFEDLLTVDGMVVGVNSLEELYFQTGAPRRAADEYLWELNYVLGNGKTSFTQNEVNELERQNGIVQAADYPKYLKDAVSELLKRVSAPIHARDLVHARIAGVLDPTARRANIVGNNRPAMKQALGMPSFVTGVSGFLGQTPHTYNQSEGNVLHAIENLRRRKLGEPTRPLRPRGTGTGGRRKKTMRKNKKSSRKTKK